MAELHRHYVAVKISMDFEAHHRLMLRIHSNVDNSGSERPGR